MGTDQLRAAWRHDGTIRRELGPPGFVDADAVFLVQERGHGVGRRAPDGIRQQHESTFTLGFLLEEVDGFTHSPTDVTDGTHEVENVPLVEESTGSRQHSIALVKHRTGDEQGCQRRGHFAARLTRKPSLRSDPQVRCRQPDHDKPGPKMRVGVARRVHQFQQENLRNPRQHGSRYQNPCRHRSPPRQVSQRGNRGQGARPRYISRDIAAQFHDVGRGRSERVLEQFFRRCEEFWVMQNRIMRLEGGRVRDRHEAEDHRRASTDIDRRQSRNPIPFVFAAPPKRRQRRNKREQQQRLLGQHGERQGSPGNQLALPRLAGFGEAPQRRIDNRNAEKVREPLGVGQAVVENRQRKASI